MPRQMKPEASHREAVDVPPTGKLQHNTPRQSILGVSIDVPVFGTSRPPVNRFAPNCGAQHRPRSPVNQTGEWTLQMEPWQHAHWKSARQVYGRPAPSKSSAPNAVSLSVSWQTASRPSAVRCPTPCCRESNVPSAAATSTTSPPSPKPLPSRPSCCCEDQAPPETSRRRRPRAPSTDVRIHRTCPTPRYPTPFPVPSAPPRRR